MKPKIAHLACGSGAPFLNFVVLMPQNLKFGLGPPNLLFIHFDWLNENSMSDFLFIY